MAHHQSAKKRIRQTAKRRLQNRYYGKTTRNAVKDLLEQTSKSEASKALPGVLSLVDRLAKRNVIHNKKAGHLKSRLMRHVNSL